MTINCKGNIFDLNTPQVMGILNLTQDSFYDGGLYSSDLQRLQQVEKMITEGASIIDVGGQSSRPNAERISSENELTRVIPPIESIIKEFPEIIISIDTFYSDVAEAAINSGAAIINDISAGSIDDSMFKTVGELNVPYILMHMQGTPENMQDKPSYSDIVNELVQFFSKKILELREFGVNDIILDPGFGFGKTLEDNYKILNNIDLLKVFDLPILVGSSRKSMIYNLLESAADKSLNGTTVVNTLALTKGVNILRVHDVKEAKECIKITNFAGRL